MISRRQLLGAMAAAAATPWLGCQSTRPDRSGWESIQGRIVGANFKTGHWLRPPEGTKPQDVNPPYFHPRGGAGERRQVAVAILGGGVAGLSAAWKLAQAGVDDFRVFELEQMAGGNSRSHAYPESSAPWGAHYLPVPTVESRAVRELLTEMGLMTSGEPDSRPRYSEEDLCHEPQERIYAFGNWEEGLFPKFGAGREDLLQLNSFSKHIEEWRVWRDKAGRKAFAIPLELSSPAEEVRRLDQVSMADYMTQQGWTSPRVRHLAEYGCRDDYGSSLETTSAWAGLHYFASRDGGGFTPRDSQFVWPEGNQRLVQHLLGAVGSRLSSGLLVHQVQVESGGVLVDAVDAASGEPQGWRAQRCIYALPTFLRPYLLRDSPRAGFTYAPWAVANLVLDRLPRDLPGRHPRLSWDNVIYGSPSLGYVVATHQDLRTRDHATVLTWYRPFTGADPRLDREVMVGRSWESWRDEILGELAPIHPGIASSCRRLDVMMLGHAMIRPTVGFIWGEERLEANRPRPPLYFAHSDLSGISIFEQAQYQGVRAAQELLSDMGHPYRDSLQ